MSRNYKNKLSIRDKAYGKARRQNLVKETLKDNTPLPKPVEYKDIDEEFRRWVDEDLSISFEGERVPTFMLLSNQRFTEYLQSWGSVDEKKNFILNFKAITRENNPKLGSLNGQTRNIPGDITFLMKRVKAVDKAGRRYFIDYKVKQPLPMDFSYTISLVTNKYELLNKFNMMVNEKFKAIDCYIRPNGHFMPMKLNDISDESEYSIDNRQFYSQSYNIIVMGYIMPEDSFSVEEIPSLKIYFGEKEIRHTYAEIEDIDCDETYNPYEYKPVKLTIKIESENNSYRFKIDTPFKAKSVICENTMNYSLLINNVRYESSDFEENPEIMTLKENDIVKFDNVIRHIPSEDSVITINGYDYTKPIIKNNASNWIFKGNYIPVDSNKTKLRYIYRK